MDFTLSTYKTLLTTLKKCGYTFQPYAAYLKSPASKVVILRHDVDKRPHNSLVTARIEHELGICGTYYFRIVSSSFNPKIINEIYSLGHEIGYHYEDVQRVSRRGYPLSLIAERAILSFKSNLERLREIVPITTICMHGSPLSRFDNRILWDYFDYKDHGIIGEPYIDTNFDKILYLTDTGRRWDGDLYSVRDRVMTINKSRATSQQAANSMDYAQGNKYKSTSGLIAAANNGVLPSGLMITVHPQRWTANYIAWLLEMVVQNVKNLLKRLLIHLRSSGVV